MRRLVTFPLNLFVASAVMLALVFAVAPDASVATLAGLADAFVDMWEWIKWFMTAAVDTVVWWLGLPGIPRDVPPLD
jgi:hypothetical protein